jgi:hypothetical protein
MSGKGQPASWMGAPGTLRREHHSAPFGSWWMDSPREEWGNAVHARWRGPAPEAPKESTPKLGLGRRPSKSPKPRGR